MGAAARTQKGMGQTMRKIQPPLPGHSDSGIEQETRIAEKTEQRSNDEHRAHVQADMRLAPSDRPVWAFAESRTGRALSKSGGGTRMLWSPPQHHPTRSQWGGSAADVTLQEAANSPARGGAGKHTGQPRAQPHRYMAVDGCRSASVHRAVSGRGGPGKRNWGLSAFEGRSSAHNRLGGKRSNHQLQRGFVPGSIADVRAERTTREGKSCAAPPPPPTPTDHWKRATVRDRGDSPSGNSAI